MLNCLFGHVAAIIRNSIHPVQGAKHYRYDICCLVAAGETQRRAPRGLSCVFGYCESVFDTVNCSLLWKVLSS